MSSVAQCAVQLASRTEPSARQTDSSRALVHLSTESYCIFYAYSMIPFRCLNFTFRHRLATPPRFLYFGMMSDPLPATSAASGPTVTPPVFRFPTEFYLALTHRTRLWMIRK